MQVYVLILLTILKKMNEDNKCIMCGKEKKNEWKDSRFCSLLCFLNHFVKLFYYR